MGRLSGYFYYLNSTFMNIQYNSKFLKTNRALFLDF